jgi:hypothetical protein
VGLALLTNHTHVNMNRLVLVVGKKDNGHGDDDDDDDDGEKTHPIGRDLHSNLNKDDDHPLQQPLQYTHDLRHLHHYSKHLRQCAVETLSKHPRKLLFLQGNEYLRARDLVSAAAAQYGLTPEEYCNQMGRESYWGGGPEIVALCNYLKRPIHVYELVQGGDGVGDVDDDDGGGGGVAEMEKEEEYEEDSLDEEDERHHVHERRYDMAVMHAIKTRRRRKMGCNGQFQLRRMACFGSPKFDNVEALHILSADSRFPDVEPGKHLSSGNHFLVMFPEQIMDDFCSRLMRGERNGEEDEIRNNEKRTHVVRGGDVGQLENSAVSSVRGKYYSTREKCAVTFGERHMFVYWRNVGLDFVQNVVQKLKAVMCYLC